MNAHFHKVTQMSTRKLSAAMNTWFVADTLVSCKMMGAMLSRQFSRTDMLSAVASSTEVFTARQWRAFVHAPSASWESVPQHNLKGRALRRGPSTLQADIYDAIRSKMLKRRHPILFEM